MLDYPNPESHERRDRCIGKACHSKLHLRLHTGHLGTILEHRGRRLRVSDRKRKVMEESDQKISEKWHTNG